MWLTFSQALIHGNDRLKKKVLFCRTIYEARHRKSFLHRMHLNNHLMILLSIHFVFVTQTGNLSLTGLKEHESDHNFNNYMIGK